MKDETAKRLKEIEEQFKNLKPAKTADARKEAERHTFVVNAGIKTMKQKLPTVSSAHVISTRIDMPVESCMLGAHKMVDKYSELNHGLLGAVHEAFQNHLPLVLSPDHIWICITQGFAQHVFQNAEKLRHKFVSHEGKEKINVRRDEFVKGNALNNWPGVFDEFATKIREHIGDKTHSMIVSDFTTTGPLEKTVSEIVLMDAMQSYFEYHFYTCCGIPEVTLEGSVEDWEKIRTKAALLEQYDLDWWIPQLLPTLDLFVDAAKGKVDQKAWESIYKYEGPLGSGAPHVTGWILTLFPYLESGKRNECLAQWKNEKGWVFSCSQEMLPDVFPSGISSVPFIWHYFDVEFKMKFLGGFFGYTQDVSTYEVRPEFGWAVAEDVEKPKPNDDFLDY